MSALDEKAEPLPKDVELYLKARLDQWNKEVQSLHYKWTGLVASGLLTFLVAAGAVILVTAKSAAESSARARLDEVIVIRDLLGGLADAIKNGAVAGARAENAKDEATRTIEFAKRTMADAASTTAQAELISSRVQRTLADIEASAELLQELKKLSPTGLADKVIEKPAFKSMIEATTSALEGRIATLEFPPSEVFLHGAQVGKQVGAGKDGDTFIRAWATPLVPQMGSLRLPWTDLSTPARQDRSRRRDARAPPPRGAVRPAPRRARGGPRALRALVSRACAVLDHASRRATQGPTRMPASCRCRPRPGLPLGVVRTWEAALLQLEADPVSAADRRLRGRPRARSSARSRPFSGVLSPRRTSYAGPPRSRGLAG